MSDTPMHDATTAEGGQATNGASAGPVPGMPLFYSNPVPVDANRHQAWKLRQRRTFRFAAGTNVVPVIVDEFPTLHGHYPIVFTSGDNPSALCLLGMRNGENLFVQPDGTWLPNTPLPAYVRRYPFVLMEAPDERLVLSMQEDQDVVAPDGDTALFEGETPTKAAQEALTFCGHFNQGHQASQAFCRALKEQNLLVEQRADVVTADQTRLTVSGFSVVDEKRFNELSDEVWLDWRRRRWIGLIYTHMLSLGRWGTLVDMMAKRSAK